jgi:hypothetical protein
MKDTEETASGTVTRSDWEQRSSPIQREGTGPQRFETRVEARTSGEPAHGGYSQIMNELNQVDVAALDAAGLAWYRAAELLNHIARELMPEAAAMLDEAWADNASIRAQKHLQVAQGTTAVLADNCSAMHTTVDWAHEKAAEYTAIENRPYASVLTATDPRTGALTDDEINQTYADRYRNSIAASEYLNEFMQGYAQAATGLPSAVIADIPAGLDIDDDNIYRETTGSVTDASGQVSRTGIPGPSSGGTVARSVSTGGVSAGSLGALTDPFSASDGSLAGSGGQAGLGGVTLGGAPGADAGGTGSAWGLGTGTAGVAATSALGAKAFGLGRSPGSSGAAPGGLWGRSGGPGTTSVTGKPVVTPEALSNGRGGGAVTGAGGAAVGRPGAGAGGVMAPMGGAGNGSQDEDRERQSWLVEEDDWNIVIDAPPSIISE